jgi:solute carrier family 4 (anion exchanger) protein 1
MWFYYGLWLTHGDSCDCLMHCTHRSPLFGLTLITGSLPHSPQFARALAHRDPAGAIVRVTETRVAPLLMYVAVGCSLALPQLLELLPEGATSGVLLYVGLRGFMTGNEFWDRVLLLFAAPSEFPADRPYSAVPWQYLHLYTLIQILCFG